MINVILVASILIVLTLQLRIPTQTIFSSIGIGLSLAEIIFLIIQLTFGFEEKKMSHKISALRYLRLRNKYQSLIADIMNKSLSGNRVREQRDLLRDEYQDICEASPQTGVSEYKDAQRKLNKRGEVQGEEYTWSDAEIDRFLPEEFRLKVEL